MNNLFYKNKYLYKYLINILLMVSIETSSYATIFSGTAKTKLASKGITNNEIEILSQRKILMHYLNNKYPNV